MSLNFQTEFFAKLKTISNRVNCHKRFLLFVYISQIFLFLHCVMDYQYTNLKKEINTYRNGYGN